MNETYFQIRTGESYSYIRKSCLEILRETDAAIFDCDGVLIDTRESYRKCILETIKYFISALTDVTLPSEDILTEIIHLLKKSGGFNNDWDAAYVMVLFFFNKMPEKFKNELVYLTNSKSFKNQTMRKRFEYVKTSIKYRPKKFSLGLNEIVLELKRFAQIPDDSGIALVEKTFRDSSMTLNIFLAIKSLLNYPNEARQSLLATVFDELFYGSELFEKIYGCKRQFYTGRGFVEIEKERLLVTDALLEDLERVLGKANFGIVSGRDRLSARYSLGTILDKFRSKAVIFLMDSNYLTEIDEVEEEKLTKPDPYILINASKGLDPFKYALFVGDSAEDIIMVKRANKIDQRFLSVGVYSLSDFKDELISYFLKANIDVIASSINELPSIIRALKVKKSENWEILKRNKRNKN